MSVEHQSSSYHVSDPEVCVYRLVFAGVAYSKLERYDESEKVYNRAIELFPDLPLARQGLQKLYTDREEWEKLVQMLQGMAISAVERWVGDRRQARASR